MVIVDTIGQYLHLYGFILGLSLILGFWLVQKKAAQSGFRPSELEPILGWVILGGLVGARVWHIATDWQLYQLDFASAFLIWQGGLSIFGAIVGGVVTLAIYLKFSDSTYSLKQLLDLSVFGLPFAQALGRVGNYVNQELYGPPTNLPWGITIEPEYRLVEYAFYAKYHPLFAYEMILMTSFGIGIWWLSLQSQSGGKFQIGPLGSGQWFASYVLFYSIIRFGLDFLRLDKVTLLNTGLGINQVAMVVVAVAAAYYLVGQRTPVRKNAHDKVDTI